MQPEQLGAGVVGALRGGDAIALVGEKTRQQIANPSIVVDQQEMRCIVGRLGRRRCQFGGLRQRHSFAVERLVPVSLAESWPNIACSTLSGSSRSIIPRRN